MGPRQNFFWGSEFYLESGKINYIFHLSFVFFHRLDDNVICGGGRRSVVSNGGNSIIGHNGCRCNNFGFLSNNRSSWNNGETEGIQFLDQDLEGLRNSAFGNGQTLDNGFESFRTTNDVVRLDGKHFLQSVGGFVGFEGPDFHFSESLTSHLGFAAERLLGDETVWSGGTGVGLVLDHVDKFQDVGNTDGGFLSKGFAGTTVVKLNLGGTGVAGLLEKIADAILVNLFKDGDGNFETKTFGGESELGFEKLAEVHTSKNRKRRNHDIDGAAVGGVRHIRLGNDLGNYTFVSMTTGEFVTDGDTTKLGNFDTDLTDDASVEIVAALAIKNLNGDDGSLLAVGHT